VGDALPAHIPAALHVYDRAVETLPGVKRWYQVARPRCVKRLAARPPLRKVARSAPPLRKAVCEAARSPRPFARHARLGAEALPAAALHARTFWLSFTNAPPQVPLTDREIQLSDKELVLSTPGVHGGASLPPAIDQIEVFAMRKDKFGWAEKARRAAQLAASRERARKGAARRLALRACDPLDRAARSIMHALAVHWSVGGLQVPSPDPSSLPQRGCTCSSEMRTQGDNLALSPQRSWPRCPRPQTTP